MRLVDRTGTADNGRDARFLEMTSFGAIGNADRVIAPRKPQGQCFGSGSGFGQETGHIHQNFGLNGCRPAIRLHGGNDFFLRETIKTRQRGIGIGALHGANFPIQSAEIGENIARMPAMDHADMQSGERRIEPA